MAYQKTRRPGLSAKRYDEDNKAHRYAPDGRSPAIGRLNRGAVYGAVSNPGHDGTGVPGSWTAPQGVNKPRSVLIDELALLPFGGRPPEHDAGKRFDYVQLGPEDVVRGEAAEQGPPRLDGLETKGGGEQFQHFSHVHSSPTREYLEPGKTPSNDAMMALDEAFPYGGGQGQGGLIPPRSFGDQ
ncbi:MAG TPA: hypothetical protein VK507_21110 [Iamia sp.]|nr:hypothetical protein [Iamia sp.]